MLALPVGKIKIPKFLYIFLIILVVLVLIIGGLNFYLKKIKKTDISKTSTINSSVEESISANLNSLEISKKIIEVSDKQRDERGVYSENEICQDGTCKGSFSSNRSGFSVMDGKVKLQKEISQDIVNDLKKYTDRSVVQVIQSNYLLCNFLYDLSNYPNASDEVKDLTSKICFDTYYELFDLDDSAAIFNRDTVTDTTSLLNTNLKKLNKILVKKESVASNTNETDFAILKNYGYFVSEYTTRYKWKNNDEDYRGFLVSLDRFLDLYGDKNNKFNDGEGCGLAWGLIDMGEYKQMPELKKYGQLIYSKETTEKDINKMSVRHMLTCGLLADKLNDKKTVNSFVNKIFTDFYDQNKGMISEQNKSSNLKVYDVKNNGMFLILLSSISESL